MPARTIEEIKRDLEAQVSLKNKTDRAGQNSALIDSIQAIISGSLSSTDVSSILDDDLKPKLATSKTWGGRLSAGYATMMVGAKALLQTSSLIDIATQFTDKSSRDDFLSYPASWEFLLSRGDSLLQLISTNKEFFCRIAQKRSGMEIGLVRDDLIPFLESALTNLSDESYGVSKPISDLMGVLMSSHDEDRLKEILLVMTESATNPLFNKLFSDPVNIDRLSNLMVGSYEAAKLKKNKIKKKLEQAESFLEGIEKISLSEGKDKDYYRNIILDQTQYDALPEDMKKTIAEFRPAIIALDAREKVKKSDESKTKHPSYQEDKKLISEILFMEDFEIGEKYDFNKDVFQRLQPLIKSTIKSSLSEPETRRTTINFVRQLTSPYPPQGDLTTEEYNQVKGVVDDEFYKSGIALLKDKHLKEVFSSRENMDVILTNPVQAYGGLAMMKNSSGLLKSIVKAIESQKAKLTGLDYSQVDKDSLFEVMKKFMQDPTLEIADKIITEKNPAKRSVFFLEMLDISRLDPATGEEIGKTAYGSLVKGEILRFACDLASKTLSKVPADQEKLAEFFNKLLPELETPLSDICKSGSREIIGKLSEKMANKPIKITSEDLKLASDLLSKPGVKGFVTEKLPKIALESKEALMKMIKPYEARLPVSSDKVVNLISDQKTVKSMLEIFDDYSNSRKTKAVFKAIGLFFTSSSLRGVVFSAVKKKFQSKPSETKNEGKAEAIESSKDLGVATSLVQDMPTQTPPATKAAERKSFSAREEERASKDGTTKSRAV